MATYTTILTETTQHVGVIRLNRPKALNALNTTLISELMDALETFDSMDSVGAMLITGNERAFAAGADINRLMRYRVGRVHPAGESQRCQVDSHVIRSRRLLAIEHRQQNHLTAPHVE